MKSKKANESVYQACGAKTTEEIIGILTAISVISRRMAEKLALLEQRRTGEKEGAKPHGKTT